MSLSKQEAEEIKKIKQSNQEIVDKINALRVELESFQKTHNEKKTQLFETYTNEVPEETPKKLYTLDCDTTEITESSLDARFNLNASERKKPRLIFLLVFSVSFG